MHQHLLNYFTLYSSIEAPFMHEQVIEWEKTKPLQGMKIIHHVPLVENTLLKIACLIQAGAEVTVTHPYSFCESSNEAIAVLAKEGIRFVKNINTLKNESFDLYFDCGAELYQHLGSPLLGAIELTGSGDAFYRKNKLNFPVISIDRTFTKQLETVFGCAESSYSALSLLTNIEPKNKSWLIFGFGKIGRGLAYFCTQYQVAVMVVDVCSHQRKCAEDLGLIAIDPQNLDALKKAIDQSEIIITATGKKSIMSAYPLAWFKDKILANLGIYDEFGPTFNENQVLNNKKAINFVLKDPTPMKYIDPEFWLHNAAALFLNSKSSAEVHDIPIEFDMQLIQRWCSYHSFSLAIIKRWFI